MDSIKMSGEFWGEPDPRMARYPMMGRIHETLLLSTTYLIIVKWLGPKWMQKRKPLDLRQIMIPYNLFLVFLSGWVVFGLCRDGWLSGYSWRCEPVGSSQNPAALKIVQVLWVFYLSKLFEYADTIFFVLRKKTTQVNFLHVFHHSTVPITAWYAVSYGPGGYNTIFALANSFVHMWMYLYYALSAMGARAQKYLWWKRYLTTLQLAQFAFVLMYMFQLYVHPPAGCNPNSFLVTISVGQAVIYFLLFMHFYWKTYKKSEIPDLQVSYGNGFLLEKNA